MLQVKLDTGFNIEVDFLLAPFIKRFLAWVLDVLIILQTLRVLLWPDGVR